MCSVGGALNLDIEELKWIKYQCNNCGKVYKSTGKKSVCPVVNLTMWTRYKTNRNPSIINKRRKN